MTQEKVKPLVNALVLSPDDKALFIGSGQHMYQILEVSKFMAHIAFIAGGAARYAFYAFHSVDMSYPDSFDFNPKPQDIDLFLYGEADWDRAKDRLSAYGYSHRHTNRTGSETWKHDDENAFATLPVQLVTPGLNMGGKCGIPDDVIRSFGLTIEQFAIYPYSASNGMLTFLYTDEATSAHATRSIVPTGEIDPVYTLRRMLKYAAKGYKVHDERVYLELLDTWKDMTGEERTNIRGRVVEQEENY